MYSKTSHEHMLKYYYTVQKVYFVMQFLYKNTECNTVSNRYKLHFVEVFKIKKHETWDRLLLILRNCIEMGGGGGGGVKKENGYKIR